MPKTKSGYPSQIKYIVGSEAAERFSFYGMRAILVIFMIRHLGFEEHKAQAIYHYFISLNFLTPLIGAYISDIYWGKYKTIILISLGYCLGHATLAMFESEMGLYVGLFLIACGAGGIKPNVTTFVGDQFDQSNKHLLEKIYQIFYFSINFGAFFASLLIPYLLPRLGASVAFGIPGVLMAIATYIIWSGRNQYVKMPPAGQGNSSQIIPILFYSLTRLGQKRGEGTSFLDVAKGKYGAEKVEGVKSVVALMKVFALLTAFWGLFDQTGSTWVTQAEKMDRTIPFLGGQIESSMMQAFNPILVLIMIPLFGWGLYPGLQKLGFKVTPLRKISAGMLLTGLSFLVAGWLEARLNSGEVISVFWQVIPYVIITASEILVSITALEFAYSQAPPTMKSTIMGLFFLTLSLGNFLTAVVQQMNIFSGAMQFFFYGGMMFSVALVFIWIASGYKEKSYIRPAA